MYEAIIFLLGSAFFLWVSRRTLLKPRSHGFYRFFAWECMLALVLVNFPHWTIDPYAPRQLLSWTLLVGSFVLAVHAVRLLKDLGAPGQRGEAELMAFERTSSLVTHGAYRYIRHPMYAALLYLAWGIFLKNVSVPSVALITGATLALLLTALRDEAESRAYFGSAYADYMKTSKRFLPFVFWARSA